MSLTMPFLFIEQPKTIIFIVFVLVLFFGAKRIPELARGLGKGIREFKDASSDITRTEQPYNPQQPQQGYNPQQPYNAQQPQQPYAPQQPAYDPTAYPQQAPAYGQAAPQHNYPPHYGQPVAPVAPSAVPPIAHNPDNTPAS